MLAKIEKLPLVGSNQEVERASQYVDRVSKQVVYFGIRLDIRRARGTLSHQEFR